MEEACDKGAEGRNQGEQISRRDLLKLAAVVGGSAFLGPLLGGGDKAYAQSADTITNWDDQADVVVVGYGGAGATSAISAHDAGASVLVLEKTNKSGGNAAISGGGYVVPDTAEDGITYAKQLFGVYPANMDESLVTAFWVGAAKNDVWIKSLDPSAKTMPYGGAGFPKIPGAKAIKKYMVTGRDPGAVNLWRILSGAVEKRPGIRVMLETPAKRLVTGPHGEIVGVVAQKGSKEYSVKAKKGVILTCGGFEYNREMMRDYCTGYPIYALGQSANTGDGILMAQAVGAGLWHMNGLTCTIGTKVPEYEAAFSLGILTVGYATLLGVKEQTKPSFFLVDKFGKRFIDERTVEAHSWRMALDYFDPKQLLFSRMPSYVIFDEKTRRFGPICANGHGANRDLWKWSADNKAEIAKGWILQGNSVAELAAAIKKTEEDEGRMTAETLQQTTDTYNGYCTAGKDLDFGREAQSLVPLNEPPYYAVPAYPVLYNTEGGPRRNAKAQVLNAFGEPIPRLYCAGEMGSIWGPIYQGACCIGECMVFGRIAGANAAANPVVNL